ncbi:RNAse III [Desulfopila aestuarii DSM 18488]|uniref:Ribonuclease 3 n=2 Tax=Desulfopila aestuarii TaxID=231440 RepID=A0A1M7XXV9_9BACT|nr:RNAse III [Desulfopila aestuarii DSM 18488]
MGMEIDVLVQGNKELLSELERIVQYRFTDLRLLQKALVHASFAFEQAQIGKNNETLEFIGDAVLDLVIGHILYTRYPEMKEGELTRLRAALVNETHLAVMAREIELGRFLFLGKGEDASHGRNKSSILSCAFEALIGAVFEDAGYEMASSLINRLFVPTIETKKEEMLIADAKSRLQEVLQEKHNEGPSYRLDLEEGPSHQKSFTISVMFRDEVLGTGEARSKKEAEQRAAAAALKAIAVSGDA